ncbi:hypothetical protein D3C78_1927530 [compost metagenome]
MTVMPTGVHHAWVTRCKTVVVRAVAVIKGFTEIQGIHIYTKCECWPWPSGIERGNDAGKSAFKRA